MSARHPTRAGARGRRAGSEGLLVALIGSDGSGKSTLCRDLHESFSSEIETMSVYFGSGDGRSSILRWPLVRLRRLLPAPPGRRQREASGLHRDRGPSGWLGPARVVWALALAREKRQKLRRATLARERGRLVVCDRYPQAQIPGTNDGPLLHDWHHSRWRLTRVLAEREARPYEAADRFPPDLVLRLVVDQRAAEQRRPDHDPDDLRRRRDLVASLRFDRARNGVVELDAGRPYARVLADAADAIRRHL